MSRSLAQAYTHTITLKKNFMDEPKGSEFKLFDDGKVFDAEIMTFRQPHPDFAAVVRQHEHFPDLFDVKKNKDYHVHAFKQEVRMVCSCGEVETSSH